MLYDRYGRYPHRGGGVVGEMGPLNPRSSQNVLVLDICFVLFLNHGVVHWRASLIFSKLFFGVRY